MNALTATVPRYLFSAVMIIFGLFHFMGGSAMASAVPIPGGVFWVYFTGLALIAAGVSFIIKKYDYLAGLLLAAMLLIFILLVKIPAISSATDQMAMQMTIADMFKDLGLIAGSLMLAHAGKS